MPQARIAGQFLSFLVVGALATAVHYTILIAGVEWLGMSPVLASGAGFVAGAVTNYLLNRRYTFAVQKRHRAAIPRFAAVACCGLLLNLVILQALAVHVGLPYLVAQCLATGFVLLWNFLLNRLWTFRTEVS
jgi:putative flippase GtrA